MKTSTQLKALIRNLSKQSGVETEVLLRDFYDIHILTATQPYDTDVLRTALTNTAERRGTIGQMADIMVAVEMLETSPVMASHWQRYRQKYPYAQQVSWETVTNAVKTLAVKIQAVHDLS